MPATQRCQKIHRRATLPEVQSHLHAATSLLHHLPLHGLILALGGAERVAAGDQSDHLVDVVRKRPRGVHIEPAGYQRRLEHQLCDGLRTQLILLFWQLAAA